MRTDGQTGMMVTVAFRNFAKASKNTQSTKNSVSLNLLSGLGA